MSLRSRSSRRLSTLLLAAAVAVTPAVLTATVAGGSGAGAATPPAHPFSNPVWWPLRDAAMSDCENDNADPKCKTSSGAPYHGYWAMDIDSLNGGTDEPVMPMGAGQIIAIHRDYRCGSADIPGIGAYVQISHGDGIVSIYGHLDDIDPGLAVGDYVTPQQQIAVVGNSGYVNCITKPNWRYLYVAVKHGSTYAEISHLYACNGGIEQSWPSAIYPGTTWNTLVPIHQPLPAADSTCIPATPNTPNAPTRVYAARAGSGTFKLSWGTPTGATPSSILVELWQYHPSLKKYTALTTHTLKTGTSTTFTGLTNGDSYEARVSFGNVNGWTLPSAWHVMVPGTVPTTPSYRSISATSTSATLSWDASKNNGLALTHYQVGLSRTLSSGATTTWMYTTVSATTTHHTWTNLIHRSTYRLAVRATNVAGNSGWLIRTVKTPS